MTGAFLTCCNGDKFDSKDITGTWYYIFKDSIYGEVIFTKTELWEVSEEAGTWRAKYKIEADSFRIGYNYITSKFERKSKDEFIAINKQFTTEYYRLKHKVDTVGLLRGKEDVLNEYVREWRERKYTWEYEHHKNK